MSTAVVDVSPRGARVTVRSGFATAGNAVLTLGVFAIAAASLIPIGRWAFVNARWTGTATDCRAAGVGACWAFIGHKLPFILFGLYPATERWRPAVATAL